MNIARTRVPPRGRLAGLFPLVDVSAVSSITEQPWPCTAGCLGRISPSICPASCPSAAHRVHLPRVLSVRRPPRPDFYCRRWLARLHLPPSNQMIGGEKRIKFPSSGKKDRFLLFLDDNSFVCTFRSLIASLQHMSQLPCTV